MTEVLLCWHPFSGTWYLHILCPFREISPSISLTNFPVMVLSKFPTIQSNHWLQTMNQCIITHLAIIPSKQNTWPSALPEVLSNTKISLHHCPLGLNQKSCNSASICPTHHTEPSVSQALLSNCQSAIGHAPEATGAFWGQKTFSRNRKQRLWLTSSPICAVRPTRPGHIYSVSIPSPRAWVASTLPSDLFPQFLQFIFLSSLVIYQGSYLGKRSYVPWGNDGRKINSKTFGSVPMPILKRTQTSFHLSSGITNQLKSIHWLRGHNLLLLFIKIFFPLFVLEFFCLYETSKNLIAGTGMA